MADDIVTKLRWIVEEGLYSRGSAYDDTLINAAAEIERLRVDLQEAYDACRYALADSPRWRENAATVVATWEARRD